MFEQLRAARAKTREFRHNATLTREQFEAARLVKFRELGRFVDGHSPYYAEVIRERGISLETCVPQDFPVLTKSLLMANFDRIVTDPRLSRRLVADFLFLSDCGSWK